MFESITACTYMLHAVRAKLGVQLLYPTKRCSILSAPHNVSISGLSQGSPIAPTQKTYPLKGLWAALVFSTWNKFGYSNDTEREEGPCRVAAEKNVAVSATTRRP